MTESGSVAVNVEALDRIEKFRPRHHNVPGDGLRSWPQVGPRTTTSAYRYLNG